MTTLSKTQKVPQRLADEKANTVAVGEWYWTKWKHGSKAGRDLRCVVHVGSNYAELENVNGATDRIHFDEFDETCEREPDAARIIDGEIEKGRQEVGRLLEEVRDVSARLALGQGGADSGEALAAASSQADVKAYETALVKAKDKTLPAIFEKIENTNEEMVKWMTIRILPMKALAEQAKPLIEAIEARVHSVELYAGLAEEIVRITDGDPASIDEPVKLFQRRHCMDEECLVAYETGGMVYKDLSEFDEWLARPANRDRVLPSPRCIVAFKVRREAKERDFPTLAEYIAFVFSGVKRLDELTFLYIRNGDQVYRLNTSIDFGAQLFPDTDTNILSSGEILYGRFFGNSLDRLITDGHYQEMEKNEKLYDAAMEKFRVEAKRKKLDTFAYWEAEQRFKREFPHDDWHHYYKWSPENVHYDDITAFVQKQIADHNRLVTVLQGLFDRSQVFRPHHQVQLWKAKDFGRAIVLVYDETRALVSGPKPDFEAYRARLNASLAVGSVTVGQEDAWELREAERENAKDHRGRSLNYRRYRPYGDPGPGMLARPVAVSKTRCLYRWTREGRHHWDYSKSFKGEWKARAVRCAIEVASRKLLNVSAYAPGDFKQFYDDPRTRAEYLEWAPLLLEAEEYHAGNRPDLKRSKSRRKGNGND